MIEKWFKQCLLLQITTALLITSLGPGFALWEMEKKLGKQGEPRESGERGWRRPFSLPREPLGSLRSPIFFVFSFFPHWGAWSQATHHKLRRSVVTNYDTFSIKKYDGLLIATGITLLRQNY